MLVALIVYRLDQYVPDSLYDSYEAVRDTLITYLVKFGLVGSNTANVASGLEAARAYTDHKRLDIII